MPIQLSIRFKKFYLPVTILLILIVSSVFSETTEPAQKKIVRIAYYDNGNFQYGAEQDADKGGYAYEYYRKLATITGWKYEYIYGSWDSVYNDFINGKADLIAGLAYNEERLPLMNYPDLPMGSEKYLIFKNSGNDSISKDKSSLQGKKIGVLSGAMETVLNDWLKDNSIDAYVIVYNDIAERDKALKAGQIEALIGESISVNGNFESVFTLQEVSYYVAVAKNRVDLLEELNSAQDKLYEISPNYQDYLQNKYFKQTSYTRTLSAEEKAWLSNHKNLTIGYKNNILPFSGSDKNGNVTGLIKDLLPELFERTGITDRFDINYVGYDSYRIMIDDLHSGKLDIIFPIESNIGFGEEEGIYQTDTLFEGSANLVYKGNFSNSDVKKFAVSRGMLIVENYTRRNYKNAEMYYTDSVFESLKAVAEGKCDATILEGLSTPGLLNKVNDNRLNYVKCKEPFNISLAVNEDDVVLLSLLNHCISNLDNQVFLDMTYRYTGSLYEKTIVDFARDNFLFVFSAFISIITIISVAFAMYIKASRKEKEAIKQQHQQNEKLQAALQAADQANKAKTSFLFNMSHDIRTPMNAIIGFAGLAKKHQEDKSLQTDYLNKILSSSDVLLSILNNVLEKARIEKGTVIVEEQACDMEQLINSIYDLFEEQAKDKNITIQKTIDIRNKYVYCDTVKIQRIYMNIISNALKYTKAGGIVSLSVQEIPLECGRTSYKTVISDTGIGMSEQFIGRIFDEFTRERNSEKNVIEGTGLGMAITKNYIDILRGTIKVTSKVNEGSTFTFVIPHRIATEQDLPAKQNLNAKDINFEGKRILLAEDNDLNAAITIEILTESSFEVDRAEDGLKCIQMLSEKPADYYELILMDIQMPNLNGYEATRKIRTLEDPQKANIPIIAVTANAFEEDKRNALEAGMNGHLSKPINTKEFHKVITNIILSKDAN